MCDVLILEAGYDDLAGPINQIFQTFPLPMEGKKVLIKPNIVLGRSPEAAATTHPAVVATVIEECKKRGASSIWVGDNSGGLPEWSFSCAKKAGFMQELPDHFQDISMEVSLIDLGLPTLPPLLISKKVLEADLIINVPKFKTHPLVGFTGCIKNMFGVVVGLDKARVHSLIRHPARLAEFLVILYKRFEPHLNIVDGIMAMEGEGPSHGQPKKLGKLLAGYNGAAVDVVIASMIGLDPDNQPYYKFLKDNGLVPQSLSEIAKEGSFEILQDFDLPGLNTLNHDELRTLLKRHGPLKPVLNEEKCIRCRKCYDICLQSAITFDEFPVIDYDKCIACWCCFEMCPEGAWLLPNARSVLNQMTKPPGFPGGAKEPISK